MSTPEERLAALGLTLPAPTRPVANYVPFVRAGNLVYISGQVSTDASRRRARASSARTSAPDEARLAAQHLRTQPDRADAGRAATAIFRGCSVS